MATKKVVAPKLSYTDQVTQHIQKLEPGLGKIIETTQKIILSTEKEIVDK